MAEIFIMTPEEQQQEDAAISRIEWLPQDTYNRLKRTRLYRYKKTDQLVLIVGYDLNFDFIGSDPTGIALLVPKLLNQNIPSTDAIYDAHPNDLEEVDLPDGVVAMPWAERRYYVSHLEVDL